jgi:hypothetical protein
MDAAPYAASATGPGDIDAAPYAASATGADRQRLIAGAGLSESDLSLVKDQVVLSVE